MDDILFTEENSKEFKESLYKALNCDIKDINNKLNSDLLETYINNILIKELKDKPEEVTLLHPMIVKLSKKSDLYDKYAFVLTNLSYKDYINTVKKIISSKKNLSIIEKYATNNIDILDYKNPIELEISSIYANLILKNYLDSLSKQRWFITYIIRKEAIEHGLKPNVKGITIVNKKKIKLIKHSPYIKYIDFEITDKYSNNIYINLGLFNIIKKDKGNETALIYLLNTCFKALQKHIRKSNEHSITYDDKMYRFIKEGIIFKEDTNFYNQNKLYFSSEINLNEETDNMAKALVDNPLFSKFDFLKEFSEKENYAAYKNTKDYLEVDNHIDSILVNNPSILNDYSLLQMEYNSSGRRKSIKELIDKKIEQREFFTSQINNFIEILNETENDIIKDNISIKLNEIEKGLPGIVRCHNSMIYKALRVLSIPDFSKFLEKVDQKYITEIKEVINQEKNDIIKKLENNRSKIFKPTTFLKNEEFLTKEYSRVARYESKINDYEKEKGQK